MFKAFAEGPCNRLSLCTASLQRDQAHICRKLGVLLVVLQFQHIQRKGVQLAHCTMVSLPDIQCGMVWMRYTHIWKQLCKPCSTCDDTGLQVYILVQHRARSACIHWSWSATTRQPALEVDAAQVVWKLIGIQSFSDIRPEFTTSAVMLDCQSQTMRIWLLCVYLWPVCLSQSSYDGSSIFSPQPPDLESTIRCEACSWTSMSMLVSSTAAYIIQAEEYVQVISMLCFLQHKACLFLMDFGFTPQVVTVWFWGTYDLIYDSHSHEWYLLT